MSAGPPNLPVWHASLPDGSAHVELLMHPDGWECRVFGQGTLYRSQVFKDVRAAHLEAMRWLDFLADPDPDAPRWKRT
jgi:hypothetical protein